MDALRCYRGETVHGKPLSQFVSLTLQKPLKYQKACSMMLLRLKSKTQLKLRTVLYILPPFICVSHIKGCTPCNLQFKSLITIIDLFDFADVIF